MGTVRRANGWHHIAVTSVKGGLLVMHADPEEAARPWLLLLERAGVAVERTPNGNYAFDLSELDLPTKEAQP